VVVQVGPLLGAPLGGEHTSAVAPGLLRQGFGGLPIQSRPA